MLELQAKGDKHPKTFVLVTDDSDGELDRINEIFGEVDIEDGSPEHAWFNGHSADEFKEGVEIPQDFMADFVELLESDWPHAYAVFERERADAVKQAEESLAGDGDGE
jgi:hypothetical protein